MIKRKATGVMGRMLANMDSKSLARTRNKMMVAARIADALKAKGISQKQMAAQMGKTESEISEWLSGDRNFTIDTLTDIEGFLNIQLLDTKFIRVYRVINEPLKKPAEGKCVVLPHLCKWSSELKIAEESSMIMYEVG
ncbi:MAG: helix-turn-helix transcriptional regulator [Muribaculaceae bacterium]|nr:helix-turn-helix transcriptional regulator [Muribaculaceae bacterium]